MKKFILVLLFILSSSITAHCETDATSIFINPGVKLGYTWGKNGGFTWGWEVSCSAYRNGTMAYYGVSIGMDWTKNIRKSYVNLETGVPLFTGISLGPTLITENGRNDVGISFSSYILFLAMPYYTQTTRFGHRNIEEVGVYLKMPIPVIDNTEPFRLG
jgi:hypothetical protein